MSANIKSFLVYLGILLLSILITFFLTRSSTTKRIHSQIVEVHDTVSIEKPVQVTEYVTSTIEVPVYLRDTVNRFIDNVVVHNDTVFLQLPRTTKVYTQPDPYYYIEVSGYQPSLDVLKFDSVTKVVPEYISKYPSFDISLFTSVDYSFINKIPQFQVGVELPFNIKSVTFSPRAYYQYQSSSDFLVGASICYHILH